MARQPAELCKGNCCHSYHGRIRLLLLPGDGWLDFGSQLLSEGCSTERVQELHALIAELHLESNDSFTEQLRPQVGTKVCGGDSKSPPTFFLMTVSAQLVRQARRERSVAR